MQRAGMTISGINPRRNLVEIVEIKKHPWFVAVQFHPEFQSKPNEAHPLFAAFIKAAMKQRNRTTKPAKAKKKAVKKVAAKRTKKTAAKSAKAPRHPRSSKAGK